METVLLKDQIRKNSNLKTVQSLKFILIFETITKIS